MRSWHSGLSSSGQLMLRLRMFSKMACRHEVTQHDHVAAQPCLMQADDRRVIKETLAPSLLSAKVHEDEWCEYQVSSDLLPGMISSC